MSSWKFDIFLDVAVLDALVLRVSNVRPVIERVIEKVANDVVQNIETKNIIDTGALKDSITHKMIDDNTGEVTDGVSYGVYNEFGTSRMAARPFFVPATEKSAEEFTRGFTELIK